MYMDEFGRRGGSLKALLLATTMTAACTAAHAQPASSEVQLDPITVEGETAKQGDLKAGQTKQDPARTEATKSYSTDKATISGKGAVPLRQVPQSVSVVTRQRIEDQNFTQLEDVARRTPGLLVLRNDPGRSSIFSRGFEFDNASVDGLPAPMASILGTQPDLAIFDRVEILRGPFGMFNGTGEPGGTLNLARKRATDEPQYKGLLSAGSFDNFRAEIDAGGAVNDAGTVRSRVVAAFQDRGSYVDVNENQVWVGYGTIEFDLTDATTLSIAAWHQEREATPFNGLPATSTGGLFDVSRSTFIGADWNSFSNETSDVLAELEHRFDDGGYAKASVRYSDRDIEYEYAGGGSTAANANGDVALNGVVADIGEQALSADAHINRPFELLGLTQTVIAGVDYRQYSQDSQAYSLSGLGTQNVFNPTPGSVPHPTPTRGNLTSSDPEQFGVYGQLRLKPVDPVTVVLGGRVLWFDNSVVVRNAAGTVTSTTSGEVDGEPIPYAGLIFDLNDQISAYVSYSEVYQPHTTQLNTANQLLDPHTGEQVEGGLKGSFFDGALNASAAVFQMQDLGRGIAIPGTSGANARYAAGDIELTGFEAEVGGTVLPGWEIYAGYAFLHTEYLQAPTGVDGTFVTYWPEHTFSLWTKYAFQNPTLEGWHVGGGLKVVSSFRQEGGSGATAYRLEEDGYVIVDAQVGYQINANLSATLTVTNLFDEKYYERLGGAGVFNFYGEPRAANLTVRATF